MRLSRSLRPARLAAGVLVTMAALLAGAASPAAASGGGGSGGGSSNTNTPPFDFTDAYYQANGVNPAALVGRRNGADGISVIATPPDSIHRNVRSKFTVPAYDTSGNEWFFTVLADLGPNAFTTNSAGTSAKQLAEASPVYVFPNRTGDQQSPGNSRQADMIDMRNGYFSNNPLGLWVHIFVSYTDRAFTTSAGQKLLADLAGRNGLAKDGTPIIKTQSDLDKLKKDGYVLLTKKAETEAGRYFICPVIKDPRRGAIAIDAVFFNVKQTDGSPLPAERQFATDFEALRTTGDYPR